MYFIRQNIDMQSIAITNNRLLVVLGSMVVVDIIVLLSWSTSSPFSTSVTSPLECIPSGKAFVFVMYDKLSLRMWHFSYDFNAHAFLRFVFYIQNSAGDEGCAVFIRSLPIVCILAVYRIRIYYWFFYLFEMLCDVAGTWSRMRRRLTMKGFLLYI